MNTKKLFQSLLFAGVLAAGLSSCSTSQQSYVPKAINTISPVSFADLNLQRGDYEVLNTITATGTVYYKRTFGSIQITEENDEFAVTYTYNSKSGKWYLSNVKNIVRFGFLANDYGSTAIVNYSADELVRSLATYRLINEAQMLGADGVIEPVISTNTEQVGRDLVFKTTVSAKAIKLKTDN